MISFAQIIGRYQSRTLLIAFAMLLLLLNLGRLGINSYLQFQEEIANKSALLEQYSLSARKLDKFKARTQELEQTKEQLEVYLFEGESPEKIASAMQIMVQDLVVRADLKPESLRPILPKGQAKDKDKAPKLGEIVIKVRLTGELNQFINFINSLYQSKNFFKIDNLTLKPFQKKDLKIFLELKGYYSIT